MNMILKQISEIPSKDLKSKVVPSNLQMLLHNAILKENFEQITFFLKEFADIPNSKINAPPSGITPLMLAIKNNRLDIVKLLLERGAKLDEADAVITPINQRINPNLNSEPISEWSDQDVALWIRDMGPDYEEDSDNFIKHGIDGAALLKLFRNVDLPEIVPNEDHRRRILIEIERLKISRRHQNAGVSVVVQNNQKAAQKDFKF